MQTSLTLPDGFFVWLWRASWQASALIVLVLLAQVLLQRQLTPPWRHALWLLVVVRLALPWSVESRVSVFNCFHGAPGVRVLGSPEPTQGQVPSAERQAANANAASFPPAGVLQRSVRIGLPVVWLAGALMVLTYLLLSTCRLRWRIRRQRSLTDGAVLNLLEDCKQEMKVRTPLILVETDAVSTPSLFGFVRPRLLLPAGLIRNFSSSELRYIFLHELGHLKRGDIPMNWAATVPLMLHWFNPLVWYAFSRMRLDGEIACDALALSHSREAEKQSYGRTIIKLLESFSRPPAVPGLVGILENNNQMKRRINMIAKFTRANRWPVLAASVFAGLALVTLKDAQSGERTAQSGVGAGGAKASTANEAAPLDPQAPPKIIATTPAVGEKDVDPALTEITVTFDRDMAGGFSWTGGGPEFPPSPEGKKAKWRDKRTCILPVKLARAGFYRVGINSTSYQNFRSAEGVPARPSALYFTTQGASEALKRNAAKPRIVGLIPLNGAKDVDPSLTELRITFNVPMGGGFSWTGGGPQFPGGPPGKKPYWTEDHKTCVLPVELKPGSEYRLGLNSPSHKNFQSTGGVPLEPVIYTFRTRE